LIHARTIFQKTLGHESSLSTEELVRNRAYQVPEPSLSGVW
jgi:hypothetical protein